MKQQGARWMAVVVTLACALLTSACGGDDAATAKVVQLSAPTAVAERGELVFCSDIGYPPAEFFDDDGKPAGADIEIGQELARRMKVDATFENTGFDGIIDALDAKQCDAIISALTNNAERREQVDFVDYLRVGQSLLVQTANERDIAGLEDIGGTRVAVQSGSTNEEFLRAQAKESKWGTDGSPTIKTFDKDTDAAKALADGDVDAYFGDSPTAAYYIGQEALTYAFAGKAINPEPIGIAYRKGDPLGVQIQRGIDAMYADGSMGKILKKWQLDDFALQG